MSLAEALNHLEGQEFEGENIKSGFWVMTNPENYKEYIIVAGEEYEQSKTFLDYLPRTIYEYNFSQQI